MNDKMTTEEFLGKILIPVDGSDLSLMAEETGAIIAKKTNATVTVLYAKKALELGYRLPSSIQDEVLSSMEQEAMQTVNDARALFREEKVKVDTKIMESGDPTDNILNVSKNYDIIIMGAHGENEKDPYALGSVTRKVLRHTDRPTLIVKTGSALSNLLVCIDGSDYSIKALDYAIKFAEKMKSKITMLNVQEQKLHKASPKAVEELGQQILSKALGTVEKTKVKVDKKLEIGIPSNRIAEAAEKGNHDLIVLGSRGLGTVDRFLLGSVSDEVSHKAKCSVLIVPHKK
jgi:nucleotide-binding universal stress UspA family protein